MMLGNIVNSRPLRLAAWAGGGLVVLGLSLYLFSPAPEPAASNWRPQVEKIRAELKEGDILFRKGKSVASNFILSMEEKAQYSHAGIVLFQNSRPYILHTEPGEDEKIPAAVSLSTLEDYAEASRNSSLGIFRVKDLSAEQAGELRQYLFGVLQNKVPFDDRFDMQDEHSLYCTELVWQAFRHVGIDLVASRAQPLHLPGFHQPVILPSNIIKSDHLAAIDKVTW